MEIRRRLNPWLGSLIAFVVGAIFAVFGVMDPEGLSISQKTALGFLCPGFIVPPILGIFFQPGIYDPLFGITVVTGFAINNGLLYAVVWKLIATGARSGQAAVIRFATLIPALLMVGFWSASYGHRIEESSKPDPPPAPVNMASPLTGRWEGALHSHVGGELPVILVCQPRMDGTLDGYFYLDGVKGSVLEPLEEGTFADDALRFTALSSTIAGRRDSTVMSLEFVQPKDPGHGITLQFVSRDTSSPTPREVTWR